MVWWDFCQTSVEFRFWLCVEASRVASVNVKNDSPYTILNKFEFCEMNTDIVCVFWFGFYDAFEDYFFWRLVLISPHTHTLCLHGFNCKKRVINRGSSDDVLEIEVRYICV